MGRNWTQHEKAQLARMFYEGYSYSDIAQVLGRTQGSVERMAQILGLVKTRERATGSCRKSDSLCWSCANAVPKRKTLHGAYTRGCEWSIAGAEVNGWKVGYRDRHDMTGYVSYCPKWIWDGKSPIPSACKEENHEQNRDRVV